MLFGVIAIKFNGTTIRGAYSYSDWMVTVKSSHGNKSTQLGDLSLISLARRMLRELAVAGLAQAQQDAGERDVKASTPTCSSPLLDKRHAISWYSITFMPLEAVPSPQKLALKLRCQTPELQQ